jgi:tetratricopeptide (TPR) repeat protein
LEPNYAWAIAHRGETYRLMKRYEQAIADFSPSLALNPKHAWTLAHRGSCYYQLKQYRNALVDINQAIDLQPDYPWALVYRINLYIRMERYEEALVDFDRAIALDDTIIAHWPGELSQLPGSAVTLSPVNSTNFNAIFPTLLSFKHFDR